MFIYSIFLASTNQISIKNYYISASLVGIGLSFVVVEVFAWRRTFLSLAMSVNCKYRMLCASHWARPAWLFYRLQANIKPLSESRDLTINAHTFANIPHSLACLTECVCTRVCEHLVHEHKHTHTATHTATHIHHATLLSLDVSQLNCYWAGIKKKRKMKMKSRMNYSNGLKTRRCSYIQTMTATSDVSSKWSSVWQMCRIKAKLIYFSRSHILCDSKSG